MITRILGRISALSEGSAKKNILTDAGDLLAHDANRWLHLAEESTIASCSPLWRQAGKRGLVLPQRT